jgi:ABC-type multidrug transport system ATPase subunit
VAILGENGSGKSTLLKIIAGFIPCDSGSVHISGDFGYCPQDVLLYDFLTIEKNIELFEHAYKRNCSQTVQCLLEAFDLQKSLKQPVSELSVGTRQKLNLIIGMMHEPSLLLLNEPYQGFDRRSYMQYQQIVKTFINKRNSIICVVHLLGSDDFFTRAL